MEKQGWKERLGDGMLNAYSAIRPLDERAVEYLKIRLGVPGEILEDRQFLLSLKQGVDFREKHREAEYGNRPDQGKREIPEPHIFFSFIDSCCIMRTRKTGGTQNGIS